MNINFEGTEILAWSVLVIGFFLALVGTIVPGLPGAFLIVIAALIHEALRPETYSWIAHALLILFALLSLAVDFLASVWGAKLGGATKSGIIGAALGGLLGLLFGFPGLILGPFVGAILGDLYERRRDIEKLLRSGGGAALGFIFSLIARFILLMLMALVLIFGALF